MMGAEIVEARQAEVERRLLEIITAARIRVLAAERTIDKLVAAGLELTAQVNALVGHVEALTARVAALEPKPAPDPEGPA